LNKSNDRKMIRKRIKIIMISHGGMYGRKMKLGVNQTALTLKQQKEGKKIFCHPAFCHLNFLHDAV